MSICAINLLVDVIPIMLHMYQQLLELGSLSMTPFEET